MFYEGNTRAAAAGPGGADSKAGHRAGGEGGPCRAPRAPEKGPFRRDQLQRGRLPAGSPGSLALATTTPGPPGSALAPGLLPGQPAPSQRALRPERGSCLLSHIYPQSPLPVGVRPGEQGRGDPGACVCPQQGQAPRSQEPRRRGATSTGQPSGVPRQPLQASAGSWLLQLQGGRGWWGHGSCRGDVQTTRVEMDGSLGLTSTPSQPGEFRVPQTLAWWGAVGMGFCCHKSSLEGGPRRPLALPPQGLAPAGAPLGGILCHLLCSQAPPETPPRTPSPTATAGLQPETPPPLCCQVTRLSASPAPRSPRRTAPGLSGEGAPNFGLCPLGFPGTSAES